MYRVIDQINIKDKKVFIRTDYNVPVQGGEILDDTRIKASLPTLEYALSQNSRIIIASHRGRPKGHRNEGTLSPENSLLPVASYLSHLLKKDVIFPENCLGDAVKKLVSELRGGDVMLLENLRFFPEEELNDPKFSKQLSTLAEVYINDSFGTAHRAHASTSGMVSFFQEKGIGFLVDKELKFLKALLASPKKPFLAILGGAKVHDKIGVIENLMNHVDAFIIGGAMAYTFLKAQGVGVGNSLVDESKVHQAVRLLERARIKGVDIFLPVDSVVADKKEEGASSHVIRHGDAWQEGLGLDIGPESLKVFDDKVKKSATIFWNGPMGVFEISSFQKGTFGLAHSIAQSHAVSVVGGGDSVSAIRQAGYEDQIAHLSTGGGAALAYLEGKKLPGLQVLEVPLL